MKALSGKNVKLFDGELLQKERDNRGYLMELSSAALLQNYHAEAGRAWNYGGATLHHGGWEGPTCQLRGHFLGHWLSAAAVHYYETGDEELIAKANAIVHELKLCQIDNGGEWVASIPEKYFHWIARGKAVWAPHYTVHKTFLGLCDMYRYAGNEEALEIAINFSKWFYNYASSKTREEMDNILDFETGGMLEIWADLYSFTKDKMYLELIEKYDRRRLFDLLLNGVDALTNMHANTTIPEIIGCARIYEETGLERYKKVVEAYWKCAVTDRGYFATGGQTNGEIWTPMNSMGPRLGEKNQEHCTVYNMIRLAEILFRWTKESLYADYIERNLYNGIMAQGYFRGGHTNGQTPEFPEEGLITYFLPLHAGGRKGWGTKTNDFFCCHGSLVQANSAHNRYLYYQDNNDIYVAQYFTSDASFEIDGEKVTLCQRRDSLSGSFHFSSDDSSTQAIRENARVFIHQPDVMCMCFKSESAKPVNYTLKLRVPSWVNKEVILEVNGEKQNFTVENGYINLNRTWSSEDEVRLILPLSIYTVALPGAEEYLAYCYGPIVLAGLCDSERLLHTGEHAPEELLTHDNEREWGSWKMTFKTKYQESGIRFVPLNQIGYERYQVYFPVTK